MIRNQTLDPVERNQARNQIMEVMDRNKALDQTERREMPSNQEAMQDIDHEMMRLRNELQKITNEKEKRSMRDSIQ